jgi:TonB family protein
MWNGIMNSSNSLLFIIALLVPHVGCQSQPSSDHQSGVVVTEQYAVDTIRHDPSRTDTLGCAFYEKEATPIHKVSAEFPDSAIVAKKKGVVWIKAFVDSTGRVTMARVIKSTDRIFNKPALIAMMAWEFKPAIYKGNTAVGVWVTVPYNFRRRFD